MIHTPTLIIGAGPAGLAMAGRLRHIGAPFEIVEREDRVAPAWHKHYDRLHLHTAKAHSALPHLPFPEHYPQYIPKAQVLEYFEHYREHFGIEPHFGHEVLAAEQTEKGWYTKTTKGEFLSDHLIVCTGFNRKPYIPVYPGQDQFAGALLHSCDYRNPGPFPGKTVLVVGMGNSGAEIALDLSEQGVKTYLSVRGPVNIVPRDFLGRPVQQTAILLGKLPAWLGDQLGRIAPWIAIGDLSRYGIQRPSMAPARQLREKGKTPVIDIGTVAQIKAGKIRVLPAIKGFTEFCVLLENGDSVELDAVIFATGYRAALEDFLKLPPGVLNERGHPLRVAPEGVKGLYFVGFDGYASGLLRTIYRDSEEVIKKGAFG
jgi:cation diffusion facilitator CzcD-associated flavoprotein CzcO